MDTNEVSLNLMMNMVRDYGRQRSLLESHDEFGNTMLLYVEALTRERTSYRNLGTKFQSLGEYGKAREYFQKSLSVGKDIGNRKEEATDHENLGTVFRYVGEYDRAKEHYKIALGIRKEIGDTKGESTSYENIGAVFCSLGEYKKAKTYHKKALVIRMDIGDREGEVESYGNLAFVFLSLGRRDLAEKCLEQTLATRNEVSDEKEEASYFRNLGNLLCHFGQHGKAKEYLEKARAVSQKNGDRLGKAEDDGNLGNVFQSLGEYDKAEECHKKALTISEEIGDRNGEALSHENIGIVYQSFGKHCSAKGHFEKALAIRREIGDRKGEASACGNLGTVFQSLSEYRKAKKCHMEALAIRKQIHDRKGEAEENGSLGTVFQSLGEYGKAEEFYEKALAIRKDIGDRKGEAEDYENLGGVFRSLGEYRRAGQYFEKALVIRKKMMDRKGEASCYGNQGMVFQSLGKYHKAKDCHEEALSIRKAIGDRKGEATDYSNLGCVFRSLGDFKRAVDCHEEALARRKEIGDREGQAADYGNLGNVFLSKAEYGKAKDYHRQAMEVSKEIGNVEAELRWHQMLTRDLLSEGNKPEAVQYLFGCISKCEGMRSLIKENDEFKISLLDEHILPYRLLGELLCAAGNPTKVLYVVELGRARALADLMSAQYGLKGQIAVNPQSWVGIERIVANERNCTCLYISYVNPCIFFWILEANKVIRFRKIDVQTYAMADGSIKDLDRFLGSEIIFRQFHMLPQGSCEDRSLFPENHGQQEDNHASQEDNLAEFRLFENDEPENLQPEASLSLYYKLIIAPVVDILDEPEIIIVPDRSLYSIPFAALRDESGTYLSEKFRVRIVPSLMTLKLIQDSPANYHRQTGALIVGDPKVGNVIYRERVILFRSLEGARKEAEMIGQLLDIRPLLGELATKQAVLQRIESASLIHFAAHGNAEKGEIALAPQQPFDGPYPQEANYLLTMCDILKLRLRAKLVVLSCCHSGRGQIRAEGVVGVARAFLGSGARSVLAALWAIPDSATEQLMSRFYDNLVRGESACESLHQAMKWMRSNTHSKELDWAPFMLIGDNVTFDFGK